MDEGQRGGSFRYATSIAVLVVTLALLGFGTLTLLPHPSDSSATGIASLKELAAAYARVQPGATRASQLAGLGFDTTTPNVESLSYLGVMERFMTGDSTKFDRLDGALQNCIEARDRCTAFVFKPGDGQRAGGMFSRFGFGASAAGHDPEVTLLVQDGRVAYKMITGVTLAVAVRHHAAPLPSRAAALMPVSYRTLY
ncbi:MAG TPA: hypothetical protein VNU97_04935 [Rhizomicrobium sp.]|jgi:hypothetical protein|nr:hypothetical protein [Rhizomicrobium sp.]